jgi:hypothetical protein
VKVYKAQQAGGRSGQVGGLLNKPDDIARFVSAYGFIFDNRQSGTFLDEVLKDALELYKDQHPKSQPFTYLHCWYLLRDHPR